MKRLSCDVCGRGHNTIARKRLCDRRANIEADRERQRNPHGTRVYDMVETLRECYTYLNACSDGIDDSTALCAQIKDVLIRAGHTL